LAGIEEMPIVLKVLRPLSLAATCAVLIGLLAACDTTTPPTAIPTLGVPTVAFTEMASNGVPNQITAVEFTALEQGEATYSGYLCTTARAGCACETPTVHKASFTLTPNNQLAFRFSALDGPVSEWLFDHAGVNYWTFGTTTTDANGQAQALLLVSLSFTPDGYVLTQVANWASGEVVECPNVDFRRVDTSTPAP
jgi:hypothetical protein